MVHSMRVLVCNNGRLQRKKAYMCGMYLHPTGMLCATPDIHSKTAKKGVTLEEYIRDNDGCRISLSIGRMEAFKMYLTGRK